MNGVDWLSNLRHKKAVIISLRYDDRFFMSVRAVIIFNACVSFALALLLPCAASKRATHLKNQG